MKKVIIGLSGMIVLAFVVILFVNAQSGKAEGNKPATEVASKCAACPSASTCTEMKGTATATAACCDSTKAATCEKHTATTTTGTAACPSAKAGCETACPMKATLPTK